MHCAATLHGQWGSIAIRWTNRSFMTASICPAEGCSSRITESLPAPERRRTLWIITRSPLWGWRQAGYKYSHLVKHAVSGWLSTTIMTYWHILQHYSPCWWRWPGQCCWQTCLCGSLSVWLKEAEEILHEHTKFPTILSVSEDIISLLWMCEYRAAGKYHCSAGIQRCIKFCQIHTW